MPVSGIFCTSVSGTQFLGPPDVGPRSSGGQGLDVGRTKLPPFLPCSDRLWLTVFFLGEHLAGNKVKLF